jgi:hypothetical protein
VEHVIVTCNQIYVEHVTRYQGRCLGDFIEYRSVEHVIRYKGVM